MGLIKEVDYRSWRTFRRDTRKKVCKRVDSEETRSDEGRPGPEAATNVVRIPRDWFGPQEELVPFGSSPSERPAPLDPNTFWGEDANAVHDAVSATEDQGDDQAERARDRPPRARTWSLAASVVVVLVLAGSVGASLLSNSGPRSPRVAATSSKNQPAPTSDRYPLIRVAEAGIMRPARAASRASRVHRSVRTPATTQIVYRPASQAPPLTSTYTPVSSGTSTTGGDGQANVVSSASGVQSSQPAFGANGALGPMSSPDG